MSKSSNEQLCALAQKGYTHAANLLLEYNSGFIRKTANKIFLKSNLAESDLIIEIGDLEQEGSIGLLKAIPSYDKSIGVKSLTYAAPFIRNAITELLNLKIILPVTDDGTPDYEYMEQYAKNLMLQKYKRYLAYLDSKERIAPALPND